ncbi:hypothetical protein C8Q74DRAFT_111571 [Fomes fomentarius]|nr:hypothetical protein C8Q74DRAFT_111571 [Fomes fomentarius]
MTSGGNTSCWYSLLWLCISWRSRVVILSELDSKYHHEVPFGSVVTLESRTHVWGLGTAVITWVHWYTTFEHSIFK